MFVNPLDLQPVARVGRGLGAAHLHCAGGGDENTIVRGIFISAAVAQRHRAQGADEDAALPVMAGEAVLQGDARHGFGVDFGRVEMNPPLPVLVGFDVLQQRAAAAQHQADAIGIIFVGDDVAQGRSARFDGNTRLMICDCHHAVNADRAVGCVQVDTGKGVSFRAAIGQADFSARGDFQPAAIREAGADRIQDDVAGVQDIDPAAVRAARSPVAVSEDTGHCDRFAGRLRPDAVAVISDRTCIADGQRGEPIHLDTAEAILNDHLVERDDAFGFQLEGYPAVESEFTIRDGQIARYLVLHPNAVRSVCGMTDIDVIQDDVALVILDVHAGLLRGIYGDVVHGQRTGHVFDYEGFGGCAAVLDGYPAGHVESAQREAVVGQPGQSQGAVDSRVHAAAGNADQAGQRAHMSQRAVQRDRAGVGALFHVDAAIVGRGAVGLNVFDGRLDGVGQSVHAVCCPRASAGCLVKAVPGTAGGELRVGRCQFLRGFLAGQGQRFTFLIYHHDVHGRFCFFREDFRFGRRSGFSGRRF